MIFNRIALRGFQSFEEEQVIDLDGLSFVVITGPNGSGKSSIFDAISWALFGKTRVNNDKDAVVNDKLEECEVILDLTVNNGDPVRIIRRREWQGSSSLEVHEMIDGDWTRYSDHTIAAAQNYIYEIIGLTEDTFFSLCSIEQGSMISGTRFTAAKSNQRRAILTSLLPELDRWPILEETIAEMRREEQRDYDSLSDKIDNNSERRERVQESIDECRTSLSSIRSREAILDLIQATNQEIDDHNRVIESDMSGKGDLESRKSAIESARRAKNAEIKSERSQLESRLKEIKQLERGLSDNIEHLSDNQSRLEEIEADLVELNEELEELNRKREQAVDSVNEKVDAVSAISEKKAVAASELKLAKSKLEAIGIQSESDEARCLVCDSKLSSSKVDDLHRHAEDDVDQLKDDLDKIKDELVSAQSAEKRAQSRFGNLESDISKNEKRTEKLNEEKRRTEAENDKLSETIKSQKSDFAKMERIDELEQRISSLVTEDVSEEEKELSEQISDMERSHPLSEKVSKAKKELTSLQDDLNKISRLEGSEETLSKELKALNRDIRKDRSALNKMLPELDHMEKAREACGPKGVPDMLLGEILSQIEEEQNAILSSMQGEMAMQVEFLQEKELKSRKGTRQELIISVKTPAGWDRPIETFSGGERVRLTLSNLFAMVKVFNQRHPGMVRTLLLDEPLGQLDNDTLPIVQSVFASMINEGIVDSIFLMSHQDMIIDEAPQRMVVSRDASTDFSTVVDLA